IVIQPLFSIAPDGLTKLAIEYFVPFSVVASRTAKFQIASNGTKTLRASTIVMIGFAVVFGLLAVFIAQAWLNNQASMQAKNFEANKKSVAMQTVVVAKQPLRFGTELTASMLQEEPWPVASMPAGAFTKISDVLHGGRRVVLTAIEPNEPVLSLQIEKGSASTEVVLQNTRVLAVDQSADERAAKAAVAKSVTLEVSTVEAQKVWLASSVGNLSLLLRKAGETAETKTRKITLNDLSSNEPASTDKVATTTVVVTRAAAKQEYTVPVEGSRGDMTTTGQDMNAR